MLTIPKPIVHPGKNADKSLFCSVNPHIPTGSQYDLSPESQRIEPNKRTFNILPEILSTDKVCVKRS